MEINVKLTIDDVNLSESDILLMINSALSKSKIDFNPVLSSLNGSTSKGSEPTLKVGDDIIKIGYVVGIPEPRSTDEWKQDFNGFILNIIGDYAIVMDHANPKKIYKIHKDDIDFFGGRHGGKNDSYSSKEFRPVNSDGLPNGEWQIYDDEINRIQVLNFRNGELNGEMRVYTAPFAKGAAHGKWVSNKRVGIWSFYENGNTEQKNFD